MLSNAYSSDDKRGHQINLMTDIRFGVPRSLFTERMAQYLYSPEHTEIPGWGSGWRGLLAGQLGTDT